MSRAAFSEILKLWRRCEHFLGPAGGLDTASASGRRYAPIDPRTLALDGVEPVGIGIAAYNYAAAMSLDDTRLEQLFWLDAVAASFNRYIDENRIAEDANAKRCLRWWRRQVFFAPEALA